MNYKIVSFLLLSLLTLSGCAHLAVHPGLSGATLPPLVPVHNYVANLDGNGAYQISPDGGKLAWLARSGLGPGVFVKDLATGDVHLVHKGMAMPAWADDSQTLLLVAGHDGDENFHIYQIDSTRKDAQLTDLTPFAGSTAYIQSLVRGSADLLIASNRRNPKVFDLYYFHHASGELTLLAQNPGDVFYWATDKAGHLLGRARKDGKNFVFEQQQGATGERWMPRFSWSFLNTVIPLDISSDQTSVWALSSRGRDKLALVQLELANGQERVALENPQVDIDGALISEKSFQPLMAWYEPDYPQQKYFDDKLRDRLQGLLADAHVRFIPSGMSRDESLLLGTITSQHGGQNVLIDLPHNKLTVLGEMLPSLIDHVSPLPLQKPVDFTSRDGLALHGYLTLPVNASPKKLPAVLLVHGGPWSRDHWGESREAYFLANRGYAVLQVNYRGSSGYGRAFRDKAIGQFAAKMHDDVVDGRDWLIAQGIADPDKVAIAGASYGGYETLVGLTVTPDLFACGVDFVGPSDLARLLETVPSYWESGMPLWYAFTGDPAKPEQRADLDARSPVYHAAAITKPLLILHGANDPRVKIEQSARMVDALRKAGKPVDYVVFQGDGHGNQKWSNNLTYYRKMEDFLHQCIGGRSGGFDYYELASWAF